MSRNPETLGRYTSDSFLKRQEDPETRTLREKIAVQALGLKKSDAKYFEVITKTEASGAHAESEDLLAISGLSLVHYIQLADEPPPDTVIDAARGTVLYNYESIVARPLHSPENVKANSLSVKDGVMTLHTSLGDVFVDYASTSIREYRYGTIIRLFKIRGKVMMFTSHNIIPQGVMHDGKRVHKVSQRATHIKPYIESVKDIANEIDPRILTGEDFFLPGEITSCWEYRFVLITRELSTYETQYTPSNGALIYIGAHLQWNDPPRGFPAEMIGDIREEPFNYIPPPQDMRNKDSPYIALSPALSLDAANAVLAGNRPDVISTLNGGGKLVVEGLTTTGDFVRYHIVSDAYEHRAATLGNHPSLYTGFTDCLLKQNSSLNDATQMDVYLELFPAIRVPGGSPGDVAKLIDIEKMCKNFIDLPIIATTYANIQTSVRERDVRHIWYNFLLCANVSIRPMVFRFFERYNWEINFAATYLVELEDKTTKEQKYLLDRLWSYRKTIYGKEHIPAKVKTRADKVAVGKVEDYLKADHELARDAVDDMLKFKDRKNDAIRKSEPDYVFYKKDD